MTTALRWFLFETRTGRVIIDLPCDSTPRWEFGVNTPGYVQASVPVGVLDKDELWGMLDPWRFSLGLSRGSQILQAGPVITGRFDDDEPSITLAAGGLWTLLSSKRLLLNPAWNGVDPSPEAADVNLGPTSLHTIAKKIVQTPLGRAGYDLPIDFPADIAGTHVRNYPGYDLAYVGERLMQATQVAGGSEVWFRPYFTNTLTRSTVRWDMRIGVPDADPLRDGRLGKLDFGHAWDYGKALQRLGFDLDGSRQTSSRVERGNGMERALLTGVHTDLTLTNAGWPHLEDAGSDHSSATDTALLGSWATAAVQSLQRPLMTLQARVRMAGDDGHGGETGSPSIDEVEPGNNGIFAVRGHRVLPDGDYAVRVVQVRSDTADTAELVVQTMGRVA